ncbi:hypothetical protein SRHO_G00008910 [Serrasalmus rhombeus]
MRDVMGKKDIQWYPAEYFGQCDESLGLLMPAKSRPTADQGKSALEDHTLAETKYHLSNQISHQQKTHEAFTTSHWCSQWCGASSVKMQ